MNQTQTIISPDYSSFIICREFPNSVGVISTFRKEGSICKTDLIVPQNREHRIKRVNSIIPGMCSFKPLNNSIYVDCVEPISINLDLFRAKPYIKGGLIHYDVSTDNIKSSSGELIEVSDINPRLLIKNNPEIKKQELIYNFKQVSVDKIKIFTIMMVRGFINCISTQNSSILQMVICNPSENLIGVCSNSDNQNKMISNIRLMWPIFKSKFIKKSIKLQLKKDINLIDNKKHPIFIQMSRKLNENKFTIEYIGESVYID